MSKKRKEEKRGAEGEVSAHLPDAAEKARKVRSTFVPDQDRFDLREATYLRSYTLELLKRLNQGREIGQVEDFRYLPQEQRMLWVAMAAMGKVLALALGREGDEVLHAYQGLIEKISVHG